MDFKNNFILHLDLQKNCEASIEFPHILITNILH